ncbi:MAG: DUF6362 family protein, partial [Thermoanaerobaculia bacterium]|nr:DUF6362 family protein [Thermoanaerobaculia bacterium]
TVAAIERMARADRAHAAPSDRWDRDPWLLNTPGGIVDLRTGRLGDHDRALAMTRIATATPAEHCPVWLEFLATITNDDAELRAYLQRVVGYCLTGITTEHALFFLYGTGANGKSVFVNTVSTILGDYATTAPMDMFMAATGERHPTDMAGLRGARLVAAIETEQGRRWAESKLKALTGGDKITARFMRQDFFEFIPQFKLIVAGNHKPSIRNVDEAMRRRLHLIPFTVTIPPAKRDKTLPERLLAESDGILAWAVEGCLEWQRVGLKPPAAVAAATNEYFEAEDALGRWLDECCERGAAHGEATAALYDAWKSWADGNGEYAGSKKRLPDVRVPGHFNTWPKMLYEFADLVGQEPPRFTRVRPTAESISRMEETLDWLKWLEPADRKIVWLRAAGERWKTICWKAGLARAAAHEHWVYALCVVAARLNGRKVPTDMSKRRLIETSLATDAAKLSENDLRDTFRADRIGW